MTDLQNALRIYYDEGKYYDLCQQLAQDRDNLLVKIEKDNPNLNCANLDKILTAYSYANVEVDILYRECKVTKIYYTNEIEEYFKLIRALWNLKVEDI